MKVHVLIIKHDESDSIFVSGVFSTYENALKAARKEPIFVDTEIEEFEVDPVSIKK